MAYNKLEKLQDNLQAITIALSVEREGRQATEEEKTALRKYSGFGGLKFILNPCDEPSDIEKWSRSDCPMFPLTQTLFATLRANAADDREYQRFVRSLRSSVLTSFYTPKAVADTISKVLKKRGVTVKNYLEPSAGKGTFIESVKETYPGVKATAFEKDLITGKVLKALYPNDDVHIDGFETINGAQQGKYDVVSSNIPFGDISVFDNAFATSGNAVKAASTKTIHNYFFLKALEQVREGGFVAFITSRGFMDSPSNNKIREELIKNARLVGAYRLPDGMFRDEAGTDVGSDLVVLQKYSGYDATLDPDSLAFCEVDKGFKTMSGEDWSDISMNTHWWKSFMAPDSEAMIGTKMERGTDPYGKPTLLITHEGGIEGVSSLLEEYMTRDLYSDFVDYYKRNEPRPQRVAQPSKPRRVAPVRQDQPVQLSLFDLWAEETAPAEEQKPSLNPRPYKGAMLPHYRNGMVVEDNGQIGHLTNVGHDVTFTPVELNDDQTGRMRLYVKIRDAYEQLYKQEADTQQEKSELREELNIHYDNFFVKYGFLNEKKNAKLFLMDAQGRDTLSLENSENGQFVKADIFLRPVAFSMDQDAQVVTASDALSASLNRTGGVDLDYMVSISDFTAEELRDALKERIYLNPIAGGYEVADKFLAGNVVEKLDNLRKWHGIDEANEQEIQRSISALEGVLPTLITYQELDFNFGERWMPKEYFSAFASEFFGTDIKMSYAPQMDEFVIDVSGYSAKLRTEFAVTGETKTYDGEELLRHALYNTVPDIKKCVGYKPNGDPIMGTDHEKVQLAASKIDEIRDGFTSWIDQHPEEWKKELADTYNRKFNCFVRATYDGSHQTFPGLDLKGLSAGKYKISEIYKSQKDCVWMLLQNGGGICDHEVGTGKTLTMCIAAHEMKRLGLAHKPIIVGMKANVAEIAATYQAAFPDDKILYASEKDFSPANRKEFFNRLKNNDYACVVMSHDQFGKIPQSADIQQQVILEEIYAIDEALDVYARQGHNVSGRMLSGLEKRKINLQNQLLTLNAALARRSDDVVDFKTMGIDHIFIDESQAFKNLAFTTRDGRVAGLGDPKGSERARNLQYAIRTIQERTGRDLGATFLSGTTISNSLTELYLLFKYLRPQAMSAQDINSFDAWAAVFARKSRDYEFNVAGSVVMKERYRQFIKVPELGAFYNEITDYKTAADVGLERPNMDIQLVNIQPTEDQQDFQQRLLKFAESGDGDLVFRGKLTDSEEKAKMLIVTNLGKKCSLSPKLVNPDYHEGDDTKIGVAAKNISELYYQYNEQKGTQFVFCDLSTPKKGEWSAYQELKDRLVNEYHIPEAEIQFIQDAGTEKKKKEFIDKMNRGDIRVMIGSTTMLGTGVNAQQRAVAVHHLDLPWRPSDMEQRNGRARRKGNEVARDYAGNTVKCFVYAVERSLDSYNFYLLQAKSEFIRQMKSGSLGKRSFDQGGEDEDNGMPFAEYVAITSGNTDLLERAKLEKRILGLEAERKAFYKQQQVVQQKLSFTKEQIRHFDSVLEKLNKDKDSLEHALAGVYDDGVDVFEALRQDSSPFAFHSGEDPQLARITFDLTQNNPYGDYMQKVARQEVNGEVTVAHLILEDIDWPLVMSSKTEYNPSSGVNRWVGNKFAVVGSSGLHYTFNNGKVSLSDKNLAANYPFEALSRIPETIRSQELQRKSYVDQIPELERIANKAWEKADQLKELKEQLQVLDRKIQKDMDSKVQQSGQQPEVLPYTIEQKSWGREPWELKFAVKDYPYLNREDRDSVEEHFHGSIRVYDGNVKGNFRHQFGAEEAIKELSRLNREHKDDMEWLKAAVQDVYDSSCIPALQRLREMGYDRHGRPLEGVDASHLNVVSLGDYQNEEVRALAHGVKDGNSVALEAAVGAMAKALQDMPEAKNAVLVSIPSHKGYGGPVQRLAKDLSEKTGIPYVDALHGAEHESLYDWKKNHPGEELPELFFSGDKDHPIPEGKTPILIDNVIDTGHTAWAAVEALEAQPILLAIGSTGKEQGSWHDIKVEINPHGLDYIKSSTPEGVGLTGMKAAELNALLLKAQNDEDSTAKRDLRRVGVDWYTGQPRYLVSHIVDKWNVAFSDDLEPVMNELFEKASSDKIFTEEQKKHLSDAEKAAFDSLVSDVSERAKNGYSYQHLDTKRRLVIMYEYLKEKADISIQKGEVQQTQEVKLPEAPSKQGYATITDEEWSHMSTLVSDLQTGNHLLGRPRSDAYKEFFSEVARAHESAQSWTPDSEWSLTIRQKELLLAESNMYHDGLSGLASFLDMDVKELRTAIDAASDKVESQELDSEQAEDSNIDMRFKAAFAAALPDDPERLKKNLVDDFREVLHRAWYDNDLDARAAISKDYGLDWRFGATTRTVQNAEEDFEGITDDAYLMTANNIVNQRIRGLFNYRERNAIKDPQFELLFWYFEKVPEEIKAKNVEFCRDFLLYAHVLTNQYSFGPREEIQKMKVQSEDKKMEESPIMKQFHDLKAKHPDALMLFRVGDFYETYEADAKEASRILGITLTYRMGHSHLDGDAYAMAGFPHHALDTYLPKLVRAGKRVAICDQLEAPKQTVKRSITEMVKPGLQAQLVETMADVKSVLPHQAMLRDALIERMSEARIKVNINVAEGERILSVYSNELRLMGSKTEKKKKIFLDYYSSKNLTAQQSALVDVFSGKENNSKLTFIRNGRERFVTIRKGRENEAGTDYSLYRHFGTTEGVFTEDDILLIPSVLSDGVRTPVKRGKTQLFEYNLRVDDTVFTVLTEENNRGRENFADFYSNRKSTVSRSLTHSNEAQAIDADNALVYAKVQQNLETSKEKLENVSEDVKIFRGDEAQRIYGEILESERKSRELVFPAHTGAQGIFVEDGKYIAFDNSTNDCWVEEFKSEQVALSWLHGELSAEDAHKLENIKLMNAGDRQAYGFVYKDEIYVDRNIATEETPLHEYTHLWAEVMRLQNPKEWDNIVSLMKGNAELWQDVTERYSHLTDENDIAEEVLAHYSGKRGFERMEEEYKNHPGLDKDNISSILDTLSDALSRLWSFVADFLHIHYTSKEQVADQILKDALNGVNPLDYRLEDAEKVSNQIIRPHFIGETGARNLGLSRGDGFMFMTRLLESAKDYEQRGYDALRIKQITGWERGADGKWRSEISGIHVKSMDVGVNTVLSDIVDAPDLFMAYPQLKDVHVEIGGIFDNGQYNHETNTITLNEIYRSSEVTKEQYDEVLAVNEQSISEAESALHVGKDIEFNTGLLEELQQLKQSVGEQSASARSIDEIWPDINSVVAHEVQHVIQHIEGFAVGGNLRTVAYMRLESAQAEMDKYKDIYDEYKLLEDKSFYTDDVSEEMYYIREIDKYEAEHGDELKAYLAARANRDAAEMDIVKGVLSEKNFEEYRRLAGEVEARNVSRRAEMTVMERRNSLAVSTEDVERDRQIISYGGFGAAAQVSGIVGLENYSEKEIEKYVREHFETMLEGSDIDAEIVAIKVIGSRVNGNSDEDSDLDVLLEFKGDISEDGLFNILNDEDEGRLYIEGIPVDINPITEGKSGTIQEFLERNSDYVKPVSVNNQNSNVMEENEKLQATINDVTSRDERFRYQLLDRLKQDCNYFLGNGNRHEGSLWAGNAKDHVAVMQALWESLPEKPEWLTKEQLADYADKMVAPEKDLQEKLAAAKSEVQVLTDMYGLDYTPIVLPQRVFVKDGNHPAGEVSYGNAAVMGSDVMLYDDIEDSYGDKNGVSLSELPQETQLNVLEQLKGKLSDESRQLSVYVNTEQVPGYALSAIINGDFSGIEDDEDRENIEDFLDRYAGMTFSVREEQASFTNNPAFGKATDCVPVDIIEITNTNELRMRQLAKMAKEQQAAKSQTPAYTAEESTIIKEAVGEHLQKVANDYYSGGDVDNDEVLAAVREKNMNNETQVRQVAHEMAMQILQKGEANMPGVLNRYGIEDVEGEAERLSTEATDYAKAVLYNKQNGVEQKLEEKIAALNERVKEFNDASKAADSSYGIFNKPVLSYSMEKQDDDHFALISHNEESGKYETSWITARDIDTKIDALSAEITEKLPQLLEAASSRQSAGMERDPELREAKGYMNDVISEALPNDGDKIDILPLSVYNGDEIYTISSLYHAQVGDEHHFLASSKFTDTSIDLDGVIKDVSSANQLVASVREAQVAQLLGNGGIDFIQRYGSPYKLVNDSSFGELAYIKDVSCRDGKVTVDGAIDNDGAPVYVKELRDLGRDGIDNLFAEVRDVVNWKPEMNLTIDQALMVADHHGKHSEVELDLMNGMEPELALQKHHIMPTAEMFAEIERLNDPDQVPIVDAVPMLLDKVIPNNGDELILDAGGAHLDFQYIGFGYQQLEDVKSIKHIGDGYVASNGEQTVDVSRLASGPDGEYFLKVIKDNVKQLEDRAMSEEKKQDEVQVQQQEQQPEQKKKGWNIDYTKYAMPEGVNVEKAQVFKLDRGENAGKYAVSAVIDGQRKTQVLYKNDVDAYFSKDEQGERKATAAQLVAKYFGQKKEDQVNDVKQEAEVSQEQVSSAAVQEQPEQKKKGWNIDYAKYAMPEGAVVEKAFVKKDEQSGKYKLMATINGEFRSADLYPNDRQAYFEKNEQGERKATVDQLVAKYFSKSTAEKMGKSAAEIDSVGELENAAAEAQENVSEEQAAEKNEEQERQVKEDEAKKQEAEQKNDNKEEASTGLAIQTALLVGALHAASEHDGVWLNQAGKQAPAFWPKENKPSAFNGMMMGLHSDANGYKTNMYTTFVTAKREGISVRGKEKGLPFNWDDWSKFENKYNKNDVIDRAKYNTLDPQEKELYRVQFRKEMRPIFNIDQTTLPMVKKDEYNFLIQVEDKESAKENLQAVKAEQVAEVKAKYPDSLMIFREDKNYVIYGEDAKKAAAVLGMSVVKPDGKDIKTENVSLTFPKEELDTHLPRLIRDGNRIAICDDIEDQKLKKLSTAEDVYAAAERLASAIGESGGKVNKDMAFSQYDGETDALNLGRRMSAAPGQEMTQAMEHANEVYRAAVAYTGTADRLNRGDRLNMLPEDRDKYERLVQELSAGVMMSRQGLPATISKENRELIPYWERELKEDPKLLDAVERDVNKAIQVLDKISAGEKVDYAVLRGERPMQTVRPRMYTIASELATIPNTEHKQVVVVRDQQNKSAAIILPAGASLEMNNEVPGMNKNRFVIALRNEGIEDVKFYNAGGALGLNQPNEFFAGKEVEVAHLKQYTLVRDETVDLSQELARSNKIDIEKVSAIKNDQNEWVFYVKPMEGEAITIKPEVSDLNKFFSAYQTPKFDEVREELAQKYYALAQQHPEYKQDFLMPKVENIDLDRIKQVHIQKDKFDENKVYVTCLVDDQRVNTRIDRNSPEWQRFWLVDDKTGYKVNLAAKLFEAELNKGQEKTVVQSQEETVTETEEVVVNNEQEEVEEEQQTTTRAFRR